MSPPSITVDFNKQINPKIIQRKARYRKIETTLRYDHVNDDMVREYFEKIQFITENSDYKIRNGGQCKEIGYI